MKLNGRMSASIKMLMILSLALSTKEVNGSPQADYEKGFFPILQDSENLERSMFFSNGSSIFDFLIYSVASIAIILYIPLFPFVAIIIFFLFIFQLSTGMFLGLIFDPTQLLEFIRPEMILVIPAGLLIMFALSFCCAAFLPLGIFGPLLVLNNSNATSAEPTRK